MPISLYGLLEDVLLAGEERALPPSSLDAMSRSALASSIGTQAAFVTITNPHELPALVAHRHATVAEIVRAEGDGVIVRGLRRVRIVKATRAEPPYEAEVEEQPLLASGLSEISRGMKELASAMASGVSEGGPLRLHEAAASLLRAATPIDELPRLLRKPLGEALRETAALVRGRAASYEGEEKLEKIAEGLSAHDATAPAQRRRLWSRLIEVQKKLDLYEPSSGDTDDLGKLERRLKQGGLPKDARELAKRELKLLRGMDSKNGEMSTYLAHLELMARLPWHAEELPAPDLAHVQSVLDKDHAGLGKVKQRVLEYLAVRTLGGSSQSTILCLVGPPGTGKTTIAKSIAQALGRPFVRVSLGGVHDECELRGFRASFVAASAGRIVQAIAQAGSLNALVLLDEIDKLGADRARSPTGALLEILDPEQHATFSDNFLATPYDLSHCLFVCTANDASLINPVLLDRLEQVELDGYSIEEKVGMVQSHLLARVAKLHGIDKPPELPDAVALALIEGHTREAGLRQLQQRLAALLRARALAKVKDRVDSSGPITLAEVEKVLGRGRAPQNERAESLPVGTAYGLSVSSDGGALLPIEVVRLKGRGGLQLTGRLGEVLKESAHAVLSHLRHARERYGIEELALRCDLHVHLPDAATPKDGPSAGVALAVAMASALTGRAVRPDVAFTGELTLGGRVLPVGGVRAKALAAERAGIARIVLPADNRPDLPEALRAEPVLVSTLAEAMVVGLQAREGTNGEAKAARGDAGAVLGG